MQNNFFWKTHYSERVLTLAKYQSTDAQTETWKNPRSQRSRFDHITAQNLPRSFS